MSDFTTCAGCGHEPLDVFVAPVTSYADRWWCERCGKVLHVLHRAGLLVAVRDDEAE